MEITSAFFICKGEKTDENGLSRRNSFIYVKFKSMFTITTSERCYSTQVLPSKGERFLISIDLLRENIQIFFSILLCCCALCESMSLPSLLRFFI